jgi:hypothetical protein
VVDRYNPPGLKDIYCTKKCSYKPKARGRVLTETFAELLKQRRESEAHPVVLCSEVRERVTELKNKYKASKNVKGARKEYKKLKGLKNEEIIAAARRMIVFPKHCHGLQLNTVKDGIVVNFRYIEGDFGLRYEGEVTNMSPFQREFELPSAGYKRLQGVSTFEGQVDRNARRWT